MKKMTEILYKNSVAALAIHFILNMILAQIFAWLYSHQIHATEAKAGWILLFFRILFIAYSIGTVKGIKTYDGYLIDFFWQNTHVVAKNGLWPQFLYPIFRFEKDEHVSFEKTDILVPEFISNDINNLTYKVKGSIRWEIGPDPADAAQFTATTERFYEIMSQKAKVCADSVVKVNDFRITTSILRDSTAYNAAVVTKMDPILLRNEFGIIVKESILSVEVTEATDKILTIETKGNEYLNQVQKYMRNAGCNFAEAKSAVDAAQNGVTVINTGAGGAIPFINIGTAPRTP